MKQFTFPKNVNFSFSKITLMYWAIAFIVYLFLYGYRLGFPVTMYYDEIYHVKTAIETINLTKLTESTHPPFGKLLISLSIIIFGNHSWAWRIPSLLCGFGVITLTYLLAKKATQNSRVAFFAAFLFAFDTLSFTQARIGMINAAALFLMLLSIFFFLKYADWNEWTRKKSFLLSGATLGLAFGTKWSALAGIFPMTVYFFKLWQDEINKKKLIKDTLIFLIPMVVLFYFATFIIILFIRGYEPLAILKFQLHMATYHLTLKAPHPQQSEWWSWIFLIKPLWLYFHEQVYVTLRAHNKISAILCIGNPAIYWLIPIFIGYSIKRFWMKKKRFDLFILAGFFLQWLPWALVGRQKFIHYFYPVVPFVCLSAAILMEELWCKNKSGRALVVFYLILVAGMFIYWYPLLNGLEISGAFYENHLWLKTWK